VCIHIFLRFETNVFYKILKYFTSLKILMWHSMMTNSFRVIRVREGKYFSNFNMLQHSKQVTDCEDISYYKPIKLLSFN